MNFIAQRSDAKLLEPRQLRNELTLVVFKQLCSEISALLQTYN